MVRPTTGVHGAIKIGKGFQQERTVYLLSVSNLTVADFLFYVNRMYKLSHNFLLYKPLHAYIGDFHVQYLEP